MSDLKPGTRVKVSFEGKVIDLSNFTDGLGLDDLMNGFSLVKQDDGTVHAVWADDTFGVAEVIAPPLPDVHPADVWASNAEGHFFVRMSGTNTLTPIFYPVGCMHVTYEVDEFFAAFPNAELKFSAWQS